MEPGKMKDAVIKKINSESAIFEMRTVKNSYLCSLISGSADNDDNVIYIELKKQMRTTQANLFGRDFIIQEKNTPVNWIITQESKEIAGYHCVKATSSSMPIVEAWFTMDLPVSFGPMGFSGLPGLIVELKKANKTYSLFQVEKIQETKDLVAPNKGTIMTREEFTALRDKKVKEMGGVKKGEVRIIKM
jgi:Protein of unknown function (Porph_ging).